MTVAMINSFIEFPVQNLSLFGYLYDSGSGLDFYASDVATDTSGNIYVTGVYNKNRAFITKIDRGGNLKWSYLLGTGSPAWVPHKIIYEPTNATLYIAGYRGTGTSTALGLARIETSGSLTWSITIPAGTAGSSYFTSSISIISTLPGLTYDSSGNVYISGTSYPGNYTYIARFSSSGAYAAGSTLLSGTSPLPNRYISGITSDGTNIYAVISDQYLNYQILFIKINSSLSSVSNPRTIYTSSSYEIGPSSVVSDSSGFCAIGGVLYNPTGGYFYSYTALYNSIQNFSSDSIYYVNTAGYASAVNKVLIDTSDNIYIAGVAPSNTNSSTNNPLSTDTIIHTGAPYFQKLNSASSLLYTAYFPSYYVNLYSPSFDELGPLPGYYGGFTGMTIDVYGDLVGVVSANTKYFLSGVTSNTVSQIIKIPSNFTKASNTLVIPYPNNTTTSTMTYGNTIFQTFTANPGLTFKVGNSTSFSLVTNSVINAGIFSSTATDTFTLFNSSTGLTFLTQ